MHLNLSGHVWPVASALDGTGLELGVPNLAAHKSPQEAQATLQTTQSSLAERGTQAGSAYDGHPNKSWDLGILVYSESHSRKWQYCFLSIRESVANAESVTRDIELVSWTRILQPCKSKLSKPTRQGCSGSRLTDEPRWAVCSGGEGSPRTQWCKSRTCLPSF